MIFGRGMPRPYGTDLLLIDLGRVEQRVGMLHPLAILPLDVEAAPVAGVAGGGAVLLDLDHYRVGVAVGQDLPYLLGVPRLLPLHPVLVAGAAEEPGLPRLQGEVQGL